MTIANSGLKLEIVAGDANGISLNDLLAFADHVQRIAPDLMDAMLWSSSYGQDAVAVVDLLQIRGGISALATVEDDHTLST